MIKTVAIVQARLGSKRLPGKVMRLITGQAMIMLLLKRLSHSKQVDEIIVATTDKSIDQELFDAVTAAGYCCFRGSENDVLGRFMGAADASKADILVRITGDCPFVDPALVDQVVKGFKSENVDYYSNINPPTFPDGLDIEVFSRAALERAAAETQAPFDREHVTPYLRMSGTFRTASFSHSEDLSRLRWTVDEIADLNVATAVFEHFKPNADFTWQQILDLQKTKPELFADNLTIKRNEGAAMGSGQKLWKRAKEIIPGGNMLLSKRAEMFLPDLWPAYFSKAKGCQVWDMDGNQYTDMSIMGIGTNILGYARDEIDAEVHKAVDASNMSTFNCPEEVYLAEKLIELHPWANMVRFARSGGEANAIAIRIARAASGKDKVAVCGYHGWHDWYLSANLGDDKSLAGHLLPGLDPRGVPQNLKGTVFPFNYNKFDELLALVTQHDIGVIKMEVVRNKGPEDNFLQKVRKLATNCGIVLIFDECTSGFRQTNGGLHKLYDVEPDMAMFGKAMGNGYAITATIGKRAVMQAAQSTFISSTFWTERIGPVAALKTLEVMAHEKSWETITKTGLEVRDRWDKLATKYGLKIDHWGLPALTGYTIQSKNALAYKTLITQEMLKKSYLASNCLYVSTAHTKDIIDGYFEALDPIFKTIQDCENGRDVLVLLDGPICHSGFKRLN
jgi:glutamate-1-semialdehyde 2,1-aminomutase